MSKKIKEIVNSIEAPKVLHERSKKGVAQAKLEMKRRKKGISKGGIGVAVGLFFVILLFPLWNDLFTKDSTSPTGPVMLEDGSVQIPAMQLPEETTDAADMIGLIVYNGKIYTQQRTTIDAQDAKNIIDEKLGTTKGNISEWSSQDAYAEEFASSIGKTDVYSVKGYDKDFRILAYAGDNYAMFFENLNGITVESGRDVFGKLKMTGNVEAADFRTYTDWNNSVDNYHPVTDLTEINRFLEELNEAKPIVRDQHNDPLNESRNDEEYRELTIRLTDGTNVQLTVLKGGYVYYGFIGVYFAVDGDVISNLWELME
ncbi:hypothetical protein [Ornithinibacillus halophilus]|uniref:Uncharacterized protein n=1 Tax=Ornithinibacillus halophilus TaxID=930117 RepID=A0A1M5KIY9_9BACI|nr:hypothetical protein [Ornithinibacillus halophilus]SHG52678.1 hypothetical protein SAMN05216225_10392 [Ornithinibacillus halophilus]